MGLYDDSYWDELYGQGSWSGGNSGQVGFSGGTSGNWWDAGPGSGWEYDPYNDEYYRPDGDYSGGDTYPGNPYGGVTFSTTGTGIADIPTIGSPSPSQLDFSGYPSGDSDFSDGIGGGGSFNFSPTRAPRGIEQGAPIRTPSPTGSQNPYEVTPGNTTNNNTTNNRTANLSQTNIASESQTNALPPIASGSPAPNPETFDPQYIPQGKGSYDPIAPAAEAESPYDYGPSRSGSGVPLGGGRTMPTSSSGTGSVKDAVTGGIAGMTGIDFSSGKGLKDSLLGLTGVNRYKKMIQDTRRRPNQQPMRNPYDSF